MFRSKIHVWLLLAVAWVQAGAESPHEVLSKTFTPDEPGIAILARKGGRELYAFGIGIRDLRTHAPIDYRTNFRLASVTKQFTATAIMLLVRDGKLKYETRLPEIFPDFPYGHRVTIRHLLNHTAGLPDYEELMDH